MRIHSLICKRLHGDFLQKTLIDVGATVLLSLSLSLFELNASCDMKRDLQLANEGRSELQSEWNRTTERRGEASIDWTLKAMIITRNFNIKARHYTIQLL